MKNISDEELDSLLDFALMDLKEHFGSDEIQAVNLDDLMEDDLEE